MHGDRELRYAVILTCFQIIKGKDLMTLLAILTVDKSGIRHRSSYSRTRRLLVGPTPHPVVWMAAAH